MKKLLIKILLLLLIVVLSLTALFLLAPKDELSYYSAMEDKIKRFEQIQSPKIILVGGSNLTFGIDSKRIESEFDLPVVNMSLQAMLGLEFMLNQVEDRVKKGDIVLLSPEYALFNKSKSKGSGEVIYRFIMNNKKSCFDFSPSLLLYHIRAFGPSLFHQYIKVRTKSVNGVYTKTNFNEYGDMVGHLTLQHESFSHGVRNKSNDSISSDIDYAQIERINRFSKTMGKAGADTYIVWPVISYTGYNVNKKFNDNLVIILYSQLLPVTLSDNNKYIFNDNLFFNTIDHLDNTGRNLRTDYVINDLHRVISNKAGHIQ
jgi:hypothetical protein